MPTLFQVTDYRGATIEDLDIKPAISINPTTPLSEAQEIAFEHEFNNLPVIDEENKKLLGILNIELLKRVLASPGALVRDYMLWFHQATRRQYSSAGARPRTSLAATIRTPARGRRYRVLTPLTPLEELSRFFTLGNYFAIVTNDEGTFVYGVATPEDLLKYENSRPKL